MEPMGSIRSLAPSSSARAALRSAKVSSFFRNIGGCLVRSRRVSPGDGLSPGLECPARVPIFGIWGCIQPGHLSLFLPLKLSSSALRR